MESRIGEFRICTVQGPCSGSVSVSPSRGGIITSIQLSGRELLFLNPETFVDPGKNVRGGIPVLFPFSGPVTDSIRERYPGLTRQHGFARNATSWICEPLPDGRSGFRETLRSDDGTRVIFPFHFEHAIEAEFADDGALTIRQIVKNTGTDPMPVSMGLHPYFRVNHSRRDDIVFDFEGGERVKEEYGYWTTGGTTVIGNPGTLRVGLPEVGTLVMDVSPEYHRILVWSEGPKSDYVCIEPVMRGDGGLIDGPRMVEPGERYSVSVTYRLELTETAG